MAEKRKVRLIACDMDGTLLGPESKLSKGNARALEEAADAGIALCVASGRMPPEIEGLLEEVGAPFHILALNGALVRIAGGEDRYFPLSCEEALLCAEAVSAEGIDWWVVTPEGALGTVERHAGLGRLSSARDILLIGRPILKFMGSTQQGDLAGLRRARARVEAAGLAVSSSWTTNFEVNAPNVHKGRALSDLAEALAIPREEVMAFGDYENDRQMLAWAGYSVAMGNALPEIAKVAKYQTGRNDEDGVAQGIYKWALPHGNM